MVMTRWGKERDCRRERETGKGKETSRRKQRETVEKGGRERKRKEREKKSRQVRPAARKENNDAWEMTQRPRHKRLTAQEELVSSAWGFPPAF